MKNLSSKRCFLVGLLILVACFFLVEKGIAQVTLVTFSGKVTDEEGVPLPGTTVNLKNMDTGYSYSSITRVDGTFIISGIEPGQYEAQFSRDRFKPEQRNLLCHSVLGFRINLRLITNPKLENKRGRTSWKGKAF